MSAHPIDLGDARRRAEVAAMLEQHQRIARERCRPHYDRMLAVCTKARDELRARLLKGLPAIMQLPTGGYDALDGARHCEALRLIEAYRVASLALWRAAELVIDVEDLPDDGAADGITWEVRI